ncbi:PTS glucose transporter subunit IIA [Vagococcus sp. BWB3-3]|uniref:PTS system sucrose-specific EIIBCA component n=1 Tax=Vagococcus allomyrinae TaxID=2794353 RepID=A0A940PK48_9ENTE|nr:beta-glucoside-specific PTS transporter subunit IIABC [Vagococcus allomyrinae]MBP1044348.1 PTS glucose transporter subunit IIA [Vagococcus allomyrinae]
MDNKKLAQEIVRLVGGELNINSVTHCITRLRFQLKDQDKVDKKALEQLDDVMGSQYQGGQYQIIIGGKVGKVYREVAKILPRLAGGEVAEDGTKKSVGTQLVETLSAILIPSLAPIVGGGMLKGFLFLLANFSWIDVEGGTYYLLNIASDCMFYFFPFLLAVSAAKRFKTNEYMALSLAGVLMYPSILEVAKVGEVANFKFLNIFTIPLLNYSGSIVPIILAVWLLSYVYRYLEEHVPAMVTIIFTPLLTLLIVIPVMLFAIAPLGFYIGEYIAIGLGWLIDFSPWLAGFVVGVSRPFLVLTGMHHAIRPITQQQIATYGFSTLGPMNFMSTMSQAAAALAIYLIIKDKKMKQISLSATISGFLGITEPALYGVLTKYRSAFVGASLGGGIGSAVAAMLGAKGFAPAMPSVLSIPVYLGEGAVGFFIGFVVTVVATVFLTFFFSKLWRDKEEVEALGTDAQLGVYSPTDGTVMPMAEVADETFSSGVIGKGVAICGTGNEIVSPVNGTIKTVFKTKHAIGVVSDEGLEILIHVGLDTVKLNGEGFHLFCEEGQRVKVGDRLLTFEREVMEAAGYDLTVLTIVTNTEKYPKISEEVAGDSISQQEKIMTIVS